MQVSEEQQIDNSCDKDFTIALRGGPRHTVPIGLYLTHGADWSDGIGLYRSVYTTLRDDNDFEAEASFTPR